MVLQSDLWPKYLAAVLCAALLAGVVEAACRRFELSQYNKLDTVSRIKFNDREVTDSSGRCWEIITRPLLITLMSSEPHTTAGADCRYWRLAKRSLSGATRQRWLSIPDGSVLRPGCKSWAGRYSLPVFDSPVINADIQQWAARFDDSFATNN